MGGDANNALWNDVARDAPRPRSRCRLLSSSAWQSACQHRSSASTVRSQHAARSYACITRPCCAPCARVWPAMRYRDGAEPQEEVVIGSVLRQQRIFLDHCKHEEGCCTAHYGGLAYTGVRRNIAPGMLARAWAWTAARRPRHHRGNGAVQRARACGACRIPNSRN